jgi:hypothetical protein
MRLLIGIIVGSALTVGGAYVVDSASTGPDVRPMVNWDVVGKNFNGFTATVKDGLKKIAG